MVAYLCVEGRRRKKIREGRRGGVGGENKGGKKCVCVCVCVLGWGGGGGGGGRGRKKEEKERGRRVKEERREGGWDQEQDDGHLLRSW